MGCIKPSSVIKINNNQKASLNNYCENDINNENINDYYYNNQQNENSQNENDLNLFKNSYEIDEEYIILEKINKNSFSIDYKIQSKKNHNIFKTMKIFNKSLLGENYDQKFLKEFQILKSLNHENIINFEEIYIDKYYYYIIFNYYEYGTLEKFFEKKIKCSENQSKIIIYQIIYAIKYLNTISFIYTDLKPEDVIITDKFQYNHEEFFKVKLLIIGSENSLEKLNNKIPFYLAPELILDNNYNLKCDIWSLGVILFQLLYGYKPFNGNNINDYINNLQYNNLTIENQKDTILSPEGKIFLRNLLKKDINKRFDIDQCINDKWLKNCELTIIEEEIKNEEESLNNSLFKAQFNQNNKFYTGLYKMENNVKVEPRKIKTYLEKKEDIYYIFLNSLIKYISYIFIVKYKKNDEDNYLLKIYNDNNNLIKENIKNIYKCVLNYCGELTFCVKDISFKEQVKIDISLNFSDETFISFGIFEKFLIEEKKLYLEMDLSNYYEHFSKRNKEEIETSLNLDFPKKEEFQNYFSLIKAQLKNNQKYSFDDFKSIIIISIDKANVKNDNKSISNTITNSNFYSINFSNNATLNGNLQNSIMDDDNKIDKEYNLSYNKLLLSNHNNSLNSFFINNKNIPVNISHKSSIFHDLNLKKNNG